MTTFDEWYKQFKARLEAAGAIGIDESMRDAYVAGLRAAAKMVCGTCTIASPDWSNGLKTYLVCRHGGEHGQICNASPIHREIAAIQGEQ